MGISKRRKNNKEMKIEMNGGKLPFFVGAGAVLAGILFVVLLSIHPNGSAAVRAAGCLVTILIVCIGIWMCISGRNRKMLVEERTLCYIDGLGRKKTFSLDEIGYCRAALEEKGGKDYLKIYDLLGNKLCKLEFGMKNSALFLQYLLDNQVRVECSAQSDDFLKGMIRTKTVCEEEVPEKVNACYEEAKNVVWEWTKKHKDFGAEWKMGIAAYLEEESAEKKELWERTGCTGEHFSDGLPEGYLVAIEGYLQKDGLFVVGKKNRMVTFYVPVIRVSESMQTGEERKIRFFDDVTEELSWQLDWLGHTLPLNRFHTEELSINHELLEKL